MSSLVRGSVLLLFGCAASAALAQQPQPQPKPQEPPKQDNQQVSKQFFEQAARSNMLEVRLGELASKQAAGEDVKKFGQMMVTDHTRANEQLRQIAQKLNVTVPKDMGDTQQKQIDRLSKLSGAEFDREYMTLMVDQHTSDLQLFQQQAKEARNEEVKNFAQDMAQKIEQHLQRAREIREKLGR